MVWFQCEDCGENLKKPKLPNHFRMCSATRLSCIDCGQVFGKQAVQGHNQCISEAEKYGPKGQGGAANGTPAKPSNEKKNADVDIRVGLSQRPPWFCSLCNTKATSQQALLIHADGKKHRAKARAVHAANQPKPAEETDATAAASVDEASRDKVSEKKDSQVAENLSKIVPASETENVSGKKRKVSSFDDYRATMKSGIDAQTESGNGKVQVHKGADESSKKVKRTKQENGGHESGPSSDRIKWKKLIKSTLKSSPDGALKMKKLQKLIRKSLLESSIPIDVDDFNSTLVEKVTSSSRFTIDGKYVRLASKE